MAEQTKSLYRKLAAVAGAIEAVEKDSRNKDQGYRYASPASVMSAVKPLMAEQHLAIVPHLVEFSENDSGQRSSGGKPFILNRVLMHYHVLDGDSGEEMVVPWQGQSGTYGDDKGLAKAQTIALRTFLIQLFQIPAEDPETDPDARDARPPARQQQQPPPRPPVANGSKASSADLIGEWKFLRAALKDAGETQRAIKTTVFTTMTEADFKTDIAAMTARIDAIRAQQAAEQPNDDLYDEIEAAEAAA